MPVMTRGAFRKIYSPLLIPAAERRESVAPGASPGFCAAKRLSPEGAKDSRDSFAPSGLGIQHDTLPPGLRPGLHSNAAPRLHSSVWILLRGKPVPISRIPE